MILTPTLNRLRARLTLLESLYSPLRLLEPMKRVGKRGEGNGSASRL